jgi:hypothetical protein
MINDKNKIKNGGLLMKKGIILFATMFVLSLFLSTNVSADEMYSGHTVRWGNKIWVSGLNHYVCTSYVYMTTNCKNNAWWGGTNYTTALSNWNNNSNSYVSFTDTTNISESKIDISIATLAEYTGYYVFGVTYDYDSNGDCYQQNDDYTDPATYVSPWNSNFDGVVSYSQIWLTTRYSPTATALKRFTITHEMGHSIGLGHTTSQSIMYYQTPTETQWTNIDLPQAHDRTDLASWYS